MTGDGGEPSDARRASSGRRSDGEFDLLEPDEVEGVGDEWEEIDVSDTDADRIARKRDREFSQWRKRIKNTEQFKVEASVFDDATFGAMYKARPGRLHRRLRRSDLHGQGGQRLHRAGR